MLRFQFDSKLLKSLLSCHRKEEIRTMKLPTVNKFLFCCKLETGGLVIGWLEAIYCFLTAVLLTYSFVNSITNNIRNTSDMWSMGSSVITIIYYIVLFIAAVMLIRGTRNVSSHSIKVFLFNAESFLISEEPWSMPNLFDFKCDGNNLEFRSIFPYGIHGTLWNNDSNN